MTTLRADGVPRVITSELYFPVSTRQVPLPLVTGPYTASGPGPVRGTTLPDRRATATGLSSLERGDSPSTSSPSPSPGDPCLTSPPGRRERTRPPCDVVDDLEGPSPTGSQSTQCLVGRGRSKSRTGSPSEGEVHPLGPGNDNGGVTKEKGETEEVGGIRRRRERDDLGGSKASGGTLSLFYRNFPPTLQVSQ